MTDRSDGEVKPASRTERLLLAAARRISLVMAFVLFFGAVACVVLAILPHFYNPGLFFAADVPTLEAFEESQRTATPGQPAPSANPNEDPNVVQASRDAAAAQVRERFERRVSEKTSRIFANLSAYASAMEQPQPNLDALRDILRGDVIRFTAFAQQNGLDTTSSPGWDYLDALAAQTGVLKGVAPELKKLPVSDTRRIDWQRFVAWYRSEFERKLQADAQSLQEQRMVATTLKDRSTWLIAAAVSLIGFFLLAINLVVLLRTERNTRAIERNTRG